MNKLYKAIGLMSGTSLDGIDVALIETDGQSVHRFGPSLHVPYSAEFHAQLVRATEIGSANEHTENELTHIHAKAVELLLKKHQLKASDIDIIGFHGQTILHQPEQGRTLQIGDGLLLQDLTHINVVNDLRSNDVAHGGQGAPLVPIFHAALVNDTTKPVAIVNIGGVANITWIGKRERLVAFDTGPGNALINDFVNARLGLAYDNNGDLARSGSVDSGVVDAFFKHSYFAEKPPKSLDRNSFGHVDVSHLCDADGAATLTEITAEAIARSLQWLPQKPVNWYVCGGGVHNSYLLDRIKGLLSVRIESVNALGYDSDMLEAQAFAFLAVRSLLDLPITFPGTTGVSKPLTGGVIHKKQQEFA